MTPLVSVSDLLGPGADPSQMASWLADINTGTVHGMEVMMPLGQLDPGDYLTVEAIPPPALSDLRSPEPRPRAQDEPPRTRELGDTTPAPARSVALTPISELMRLRVAEEGGDQQPSPVERATRPEDQE